MRTSAPAAMPNPSTSDPICVARTGSGPRPSPAAVAARERDDRQREIGPVVARRGEQERGPNEHRGTRPKRAAWPESPRDDEAEERREEDGGGHERLLRRGRAEERLLERGREGADV